MFGIKKLKPRGIKALVAQTPKPSAIKAILGQQPARPALGMFGKGQLQQAPMRTSVGGRFVGHPKSHVPGSEHSKRFPLHQQPTAAEAVKEMGKQEAYLAKIGPRARIGPYADPNYKPTRSIPKHVPAAAPPRAPAPPPAARAHPSDRQIAEAKAEVAHHQWKVADASKPDSDFRGSLPDYKADLERAQRELKTAERLKSRNISQNKANEKRRLGRR